MRQYLSKLQKNSENFLLYFAQPQNILQRPSFFGISKQPKIIVELNALRDSVPFVQFNVKNTHGGVLLLSATLLKETLLHVCFLHF